MWTLPIAPHWNWNYLRNFVFRKDFGYQSHHTGIETHKTNHCFNRPKHYQSHHTGIETARRLARWRSHQLPIAPHWNWNDGMKLKFKVKDYLPIAPHWNWNWSTRLKKRAGRATNRTTLELKHGQVLLCKAWKSCYQSHHTGIETSNRRWKHRRR